MDELPLNHEAAERVHYATDPRIRLLAEAKWRWETGGSRMDWLMLGKDNPEAMIREAREWVRAAVAIGILSPPNPPPRRGLRHAVGSCGRVNFPF